MGRQKEDESTLPMQSTPSPRQKVQLPDAVSFRAAFTRLDRNGDGVLCLEEAVKGLLQIGIPVSRKDAAILFKQVDTDGDGFIDVREFETYCLKKIGLLRRAYDQVDTNRNGKLTPREVREAAKRSGLKISDEQLRQLFQRLDINRDGVITFPEFCESLVLLPAINPRAVFESWQHFVPIDDAESEYSVVKDTPTLVGSLLSGGIAGAVSRTATAPLDRVKALLQATAPGSAQPSLADTFRQIWTEGGLKAFFRGNGVNVLKIGPETATKFTAFDVFKRALAEDPGNVTVVERFVSGGLAGALAQLMIYPLETVKTRMAISPPGLYSSVAGCMRSVATAEGPSALYRGLVPSLIGIVPYAGIDLMANSLLKDLVADRYEKCDEEPGVLELLGCGMVSSTVAMLCTYPLNLVRTRLQASGMPGSPRYSSAMQCLRQTLAAEGARGLYRGILPNCAKVLPATSISYAVYDVVNNALAAETDAPQSK